MTKKENTSKDLCPKPPPLFAREATGLVRAFGWREAFFISQGVQAASFWSIASQIGFVLGADPGADLVLSALLGFLFCLPMAIVYFLLGTSMPRSGGDYVWISRVVNPVVGFASGWGYWIAIGALNGVTAWLIPAVILPPFLVSLGYGFGIPQLVALSSAICCNNTNIFFIGVVFLAFGFIMSGLGAKVFSRVVTVMFAFVLIGTIVGFYFLAASTRADFVRAINGYGGTDLTFDGVISQAQSAGWSYAPLALSTTLTSIPFSILLFTGFNFAAAASGEIKSTKKSLLVGILGALMFGLVINAIGIWLAVNLIGYPFLQASGFLNSNGKWPIPAPPWLGLLISPLIHNGLLLILVQLGWVLMLPMELVALSLVCTRYSFAFSFDRVLPAKVSEISSRFYFPLNSSVLNFVIGAIFLGLATFTSYLGLYLNQVTIWSAVWFLSSVVAVLLPYSKFKELARGLPGAGWRIPSVTIAGIFSMLTMAATFYYAVSTPAIGPSTQGAQLILAVIFLVGALVYVVSYYYNKRQGIDPRLIYSNIPPE